MKLKHHLLLGFIAGVVFNICGLSIFHNPFKFLLMTAFYVLSIFYAEYKERHAPSMS